METCPSVQKVFLRFHGVLAQNKDFDAKTYSSQEDSSWNLEDSFAELEELEADTFFSQENIERIFKHDKIYQNG